MMKKTYTEFIVRVYHKRRESSKHLFLQWLRFCLKPYLALRKVTVKKHKSKGLSEDKLFDIIYNSPFEENNLRSWALPLEEARKLAKTIYNAQEGR